MKKYKLIITPLFTIKKEIIETEESKNIENISDEDISNEV